MKKVSKAIMGVAGAAFVVGAMMTTPADAGPRRRAVQNYEEQEEIGAALGGLALAVGILVDDATVAIENIHRNIAMRKRFFHRS